MTRRDGSKEGGKAVSAYMEEAGVQDKHKGTVLVLKPSAEGPVTFLKKSTSESQDPEVQDMEVVRFREEFKPFKPPGAHADFIFEVMAFNRGKTSEEVILKDPHKLVRFKVLENWEETWSKVCESLKEKLYKCEQCEDSSCSYVIHPGDGEQ